MKNHWLKSTAMGLTCPPKVRGLPAPTFLLLITIPRDWLSQNFLVSVGILFQQKVASTPLRCLTFLKNLLPERGLLVLNLPSLLLKVLLFPFFFFQRSFITVEIWLVDHLLCSFLSLEQWCLKKERYSLLDFLTMPLLLTKTGGVEESPSLLSSFCSDPLLKSEPSLEEALTLEWNLVALKEVLMDFLAACSAATLASLLARSALTRASEEEMSQLVRQFFSSQILWRLPLAA